jgi:hypothetical protein
MGYESILFTSPSIFDLVVKNWFKSHTKGGIIIGFETGRSKDMNTRT